jgi:hypothetical protein
LRALPQRFFGGCQATLLARENECVGSLFYDSNMINAASSTWFRVVLRPLSETTDPSLLAISFGFAFEIICVIETCPKRDYFFEPEAW